MNEAPRGYREAAGLRPASPGGDGEAAINLLPVVVDDCLVGIVTDHDLREVFQSVFDSPGCLNPVSEAAYPYRLPAADPRRDRLLDVEPEIMRGLVVRRRAEPPLCSPSP